MILMPCSAVTNLAKTPAIKPITIVQRTHIDSTEGAMYADCDDLNDADSQANNMVSAFPL